nr:MAG TPA: hypothetical protein [Caudoviricetes sp.]
MGNKRLEKLLKSDKVPIRGGYGWMPTIKQSQTLREPLQPESTIAIIL